MKFARFDVVVLDLFLGECGIGLASALGKPVVGYWGMTPSGMWMDYTGTVKEKDDTRLRYFLFLVKFAS